MASDDVIELGSSDEEIEPAPKKRKPPPNAMVHIPNKLSKGISISPSKNAKLRLNPSSIIKGTLGQAVTVTKISNSNVNPFVNTKKLNGSPVSVPIKIKPISGMKKTSQGAVQKPSNAAVTGIPITNASKVLFNPNKATLNTSIKKLSNANNLRIVTLSKPTSESMSVKKTSLKGTRLPPGITIKRTTAPCKSNKIVLPRNCNPYSVLRQKPIIRAVPTGGLTSASVPTVNIDDDDSATYSGSGPQWYLRPEEQDKNDLIETEDKSENSPSDKISKEETKDNQSIKKAENSENTSPMKLTEETEPSVMEKQNNKEPDKIKYIEITIEDSPIKPTKKGFKVGAELAITIEDSPVKVTADNDVQSENDSVDEDSPKDSRSKKKLEYSKTIEAIQELEIEFEPPPAGSTCENQSGSHKDTECSNKAISPSRESISSKKIPCLSTTDNENPKEIEQSVDIVEIEESPIKPVEEIKATTPKKIKTSKPVYKIQQAETIVLDLNEKNEFSSIYQDFINMCFEQENSEDMKKIVEKKIKAYYRQVPKEYTESEAFTDMVAGKIMAIKAGPEKMYLYIKDIVDELNLQRKMAKSKIGAQKEEQQKFLYGEESEFDAKRQRQIRKLEKTLQKLHRAIQKLEEQEVDFDDEEDSVYLLTERYKERSVRVHAKLCQLTNTKMPSEARVLIDPRPGQPKGPAKRLEKWINRKVPIGTPLPFPDFHDVLRCVKEANEEDKLGWNDADVMEEARDLFVRCGKKLQRRRQENEWRLAVARVPAGAADPAHDSHDLKRKLDDNRRLAAKREADVFNKYADRQNQLKLEAVEIGDKEAEESPVESDDEDAAEDTDSLTDAEKRKERIKKLLQQKGKTEKGNQSDSHTRIEDENKDKDTEKENNIDDNKMATESHHEKPPKPETDKSRKSDAIDSDSSSKSKGRNRVDSDVDELHLLEKLYSENEFNNSVVSSSDSPIAISDASSIDDEISQDERLAEITNDVISIENSSYSESEERKENPSKDEENLNNDDNVNNEDNFNNVVKLKKKKIIEQDVNLEQECTVDRQETTTNKSNNEDDNGTLEDILLASSDDEATEKQTSNPVNETCINLKDDSISIGDTVIVDNRDLDGDSEASNSCNAKSTVTDGSSVEGMEIGPMEINSGDIGLVNNTDSVNVDSLDDVNVNKIAGTNSPKSIEDKISIEITDIHSVETIQDDANTEVVNEIINVESANIISEDKDKSDNVRSMHVDLHKEEDNSTEIEAPALSDGDISMKETVQDANKVRGCTENDNVGISDKENEQYNLATNVDSVVPSSEDVPVEKEKDVNKTNATNKVVENLPDKENANNNRIPESMEVD